MRIKGWHLFRCPVWSWPRRTLRMHETCLALGPFRAVKARWL